MPTRTRASANDGMLAVKVIILTFDDDTHRLAGSRDARKVTSMSAGQSISALPKDYLPQILGYGEDREAEAKRRAKKVNGILARFGVEGVGTDASQSLSGEDPYDRHATR